MEKSYFVFLIYIYKKKRLAIPNIQSLIHYIKILSLYQRLRLSEHNLSEVSIVWTQRQNFFILRMLKDRSWPSVGLWPLDSHWICLEQSGCSCFEDVQADGWSEILILCSADHWKTKTNFIITHEPIYRFASNLIGDLGRNMEMTLAWFWVDQL